MSWCSLMYHVTSCERFIKIFSLTFDLSGLCFFLRDDFLWKRRRAQGNIPGQSRDSSVDITTRLRGLYLGKGKTLFSSPARPDGLCGLHIPLFSGYLVVLGGKAAGAWSWLLSSCWELEEGFSYISASSVCLHGVNSVTNFLHFARELCGRKKNLLEIHQLVLLLVYSCAVCVKRMGSEVLSHGQYIAPRQNNIRCMLLVNGLNGVAGKVAVWMEVLSLIIRFQTA
jgi:hypothetical protein